MKKLVIIYLFTSFIFINTCAQPCLPNGITFTEQYQIDHFQTNYPNCTEIEGNIIIGSDIIYPEIYNLSGLNNLTKIGGDLTIVNTNINNFSGLNNLDSIGGNLNITNNSSIDSFSGLENLVALEGDLFIDYNSSLTTLSGIENINESTIENLTITDNSSLSYCEVESVCAYLNNPNGRVIIYGNDDGCKSPPEIANSCGISLSCLPFGDYYFSSQQEINSFSSDYQNCSKLIGQVWIQNGDISNLDSLNIVTAVQGDLTISQLYHLISLEGLINIDTIHGNLSIAYCGVLPSLHGLDSINYIKGIRIHGNPTLTDLSGLENLTYFENDLIITGHQNLLSLNGLNNIDSVGHTLMISGNDRLVNLTGLSKITKIDYFVYINDNDYLINLLGLENLKSSGENFIISNNLSLESLSGLTNLKEVGDFELFLNPALNSLIGLDSLKNFGGTFNLSGTKVTSLEGLENIDSIGGDFMLSHNNKLTSLIQFENLSKIGGDLILYSNSRLTNLIGLDNINASSIKGLYIRENDSLSLCSVESICEYLADPNGIIKIEYNTLGCNNQNEVEEACLVVNQDQFLNGSNVIIYPNPTESIIHTSLKNHSIKKINIYNQFGQRVLSHIHPIEKIDVSTLNSGVYIIELFTSENRITEKLIIR